IPEAQTGEPLVRAGSEDRATPHLTTRIAEIAPQVASKQFSDALKRRPPIEVAIRLNDRWAVAFDSRQWMLSQRRGKEWRPSKFCYERDHMLEIIGETCGNVRPEALAEIRTWPPRHATWYRLRTGRPTPSIALAARAIAGELATLPVAAE